MGASASLELVGQRQDQRDARRLVARIYREDVETNALGLLWIIEQAVVLGPLDGAFDRVGGNAFESEAFCHPDCSSERVFVRTLRPAKSRAKRASGS